MDTKIEEFLKNQQSLTFCTSVDNQPYCANAFYACIKENNLIVFKSDKNTRHISEALKNEKVAGIILPDVSKIGTIKGIQFTGIFFSIER